MYWMYGRSDCTVDQTDLGSAFGTQRRVFAGSLRFGDAISSLFPPSTPDATRVARLWPLSSVVGGCVNDAGAAGLKDGTCSEGSGWETVLGGIYNRAEGEYSSILGVSSVSLLAGVEPVEVDELHVVAVMRGGEEGSIEPAG